MNATLKPSKPTNELARLESLRSFEIIDTEPEAFFDKITKLASYICGTTMALVTFLEEDRQWIKSKVGLQLKETSRDEAFCAYAIHQSDTMIVSDPLEDDRFKYNPQVTGEPHIRFYAGAPLMTSSGHGLGTLCVLDTKPIQLSSDQLNALNHLRDLALRYLELRKNAIAFDRLDREVNVMSDRVGKMAKEIETKDSEINELAKVLSHDFRAPLRGIASLADWMVEDYYDQLPEDVREQLMLIKDRTLKLNEILDAVIQRSRKKQESTDNS